MFTYQVFRIVIGILTAFRYLLYRLADIDGLHGAPQARFQKMGREVRHGGRGVPGLVGAGTVPWEIVARPESSNMTWIWAAVLGALVLIVSAAFLLVRPIRIPRDPEREGYQDEEASLAYDRTSRWPVFALERYIVLRAMGRKRIQGTLLDVGCGPGFLAAKIGHRYPDLEVLGLDLNRYMISLASVRLSQSRGKYGLVMGDASSLPFSASSIDMVVSSLSLHHWKDPSAAFQEVYRILAPGGRLIIFDVRRDVPSFVFCAFIVGQALFSPRAIRRTNGAVGSVWSSYTAGELDRLLAAQQFESVEVRRGLAWLVLKAEKLPNSRKTTGDMRVASR